MARDCLRDRGRSSMRTWSRPSKREGSSRHSVGLAPREDAHGSPGAARQKVVDPRQALAVRPLRVLEHDDQRVVARHAHGHVGEHEPQRVARAARVVDLGQRLVRDEAREQLARRLGARRPRSRR